MHGWQRALAALRCLLQAAALQQPLEPEHLFKVRVSFCLLHGVQGLDLATLCRLRTTAGSSMCRTAAPLGSYCCRRPAQRTLPPSMR